LLTIVSIETGIAACKCVVRQITGAAVLPFKLDLPTYTFRVTTAAASLRQARYLGSTGDDIAQKILCRRRFAESKYRLYQKVCCEEFWGYWIFRNTDSGDGDGEEVVVGEVDVVIYFLHGGGYCYLQPGNYTLFLLRLAEVLGEQFGLRVAVFALDYSLAPEAVFPCQLRQAAHAYRHLTVTCGIDPEKIVLLGDSAGGNASFFLSFFIKKGGRFAKGIYRKSCTEFASASRIAASVTYTESYARRTDHKAKICVFDVAMGDVFDDESIL
jgi:acetyl esterase/lipase